MNKDVLCKLWIKEIKSLNAKLQNRFITKYEFICLVKNLISLPNCPIMDLEYIITSTIPFKPVKIKIYQQENYSKIINTYNIILNDNRFSRCRIKIWIKNNFSITTEEIKQIKNLIKNYWKPNFRTYSAGLIDLKRSLKVKEIFTFTCKFLIKQNIDISLLYCDIDNFKKVNSVYGLSAGDRIIREVGAILEYITISSSILLHNGGDEFVILLDAKNSESILNKIKDNINSYDFRLNFELNITIGVSNYTNNCDNLIESAYLNCQIKKDKKFRFHIW